MPCKSSWDEPTSHELREQEMKVRAELNETTRLLCEVCGALERAKLEMPKHLQEWWDKHKVFDRSQGR